MAYWLQLLFICSFLELAVGHGPKKKAELDDDSSGSSSSSSSESREVEGNDETKSSEHENHTFGLHHALPMIFHGLKFPKPTPTRGSRAMNHGHRQAVTFSPNSDVKDIDSVPKQNIYPRFQPVPYWGKMGSPKMNDLPHKVGEHDAKSEHSRNDDTSGSKQGSSSSESDESEGNAENKNPKQSKNEFLQRPFGRRPFLKLPLKVWNLVPYANGLADIILKQNDTDHKNRSSDESDDGNSGKNNNPNRSKYEFLRSPLGQRNNAKPMPNIKADPNLGAIPYIHTEFQRFPPNPKNNGYYVPAVEYFLENKPISNWVDRGSPQMNGVLQNVDESAKNAEENRNEGDPSDSEDSSSSSSGSGETKVYKLEGFEGNGDLGNLKRGKNGVSGSRFGPKIASSFKSVPVWSDGNPQMNLVPTKFHKSARNSDRRHNNDDEPSDSVGGNSRESIDFEGHEKAVGLLNPIKYDPKRWVSYIGGPYLRENPVSSEKRNLKQNDKPNNPQRRRRILLLQHPDKRTIRLIPNWGNERVRELLRLLLLRSPPNPATHSGNINPSAENKKSITSKSSELGSSDDKKIPKQSAKRAYRMNETSRHRKKHRADVRKKHNGKKN